MKQFHFKAMENPAKTRFVLRNQNSVQQDVLLHFLGDISYQNEIEFCCSVLFGHLTRSTSNPWKILRSPCLT